jgi:hypothetical protein
MCPMMLMCAPVAFSGSRLTSVSSVLPSQALRIRALIVLPSRSIARSTFENSVSTASIRLSSSPGSRPSRTA